MTIARNGSAAPPGWSGQAAARGHVRVGALDDRGADLAQLLDLLGGEPVDQGPPDLVDVPRAAAASAAKPSSVSCAI